jgi:hypothetical protein
MRRSERLRNAMLLLADDLEAYDSAVALLAVHCAISLNDAIQVGTTGKRSKYENHARTLSALERICRSTCVDTTGITHLKWLLTNKTAISYGDRRFTDTATARDKAERFQTWAYGSFKEVLRVQEYS